MNLQHELLFSTIILMDQLNYVLPYTISSNYKKSSVTTKYEGVIEFLRKEIRNSIRSTRVKRSSAGSGRFAEAAQSPMIKVVRQVLQGFANTWSSSPIGGRHPLDPDVAYGVVYLFKTGLWDHFFPEVGRAKEIED